MQFHSTPLADLRIITFEPRSDERGHLTRVFCEQELRTAGIEFPIRQINRSLTLEQDFLRGMHYQRAPKDEGKIVQCLRGAVYDVAVDLRNGSATYLKWHGVELREGDQKAFYIPKGFAHGFVTLAPNAELLYLMSEAYSSEHATGVRWNDPAIGIVWPGATPQMNERDAAWPLL